jgi:hypothetical protein
MATVTSLLADDARKTTGEALSGRHLADPQSRGSLGACQAFPCHQQEQFTVGLRQPASAARSRPRSAQRQHRTGRRNVTNAHSPHRRVREPERLRPKHWANGSRNGRRDEHPAQPHRARSGCDFTLQVAIGRLFSAATRIEGAGPVESVWSVLKRSLANLVRRDLAQLTALAKTRLRRMQYRPGLLEGFLAGARLDLTPFCNPKN